jgi:hypothetical protein
MGCPHVFVMLTCNPWWAEILSQLHDGQTAFDRPDVTTAVFKSRPSEVALCPLLP